MNIHLLISFLLIVLVWIVSTSCVKHEQFNPSYKQLKRSNFTPPPSDTILFDEMKTKVQFRYFDPNLYEDKVYPVPQACETSYRLIPEEFDARIKWPRYIGKIRNQGSCGSCWAFATASCLGDRFAIMSQGQVADNLKNKDGDIVVDADGSYQTTGPLELAAQMLIVCQYNITYDKDGNPIAGTKNTQACHGNNLENTWRYLRDLGTSTEECVPYTLSNWFKEDPVPSCTDQIGKDFASCSNGKPMDLIFRAINAYAVPGTKEQGGCVSQIQTEILQLGPVTSGFAMTADFQNWNGIFPPVYKYDGVSPSRGGHAVKIIGWGVYNHAVDPKYMKLSKPVNPKIEEEYKKHNGEEYWIIANTWGPKWGRDGYFYMLKGTNERMIEENVVCGEPDLMNTRQQKIDEDKDVYRRILARGYECFSESHKYNICTTPISHEGRLNPLGERGWNNYMYKFVWPKKIKLKPLNE